MKRPLRPEEVHIWAKVAATVRPAAGRKPHKPPTEAPASPADVAKPAAKGASPKIAKAKPAPAGPRPVAAPPPASPKVAHPKPKPPPEPIEPRRKRRIVLENELGPRLDLHGLDQDQARAVLTGFLRRASEDGWRAVLVITGKGSRGDGVLRRMTPEWLADPALRHLVAGVSEAHRSHGGGGALYVALKRRGRG